MNVEKKLHDRFAAVSNLTDLLPAARFFTGRIPRDTTTPCGRLYVSGALITKRSNKAIERTIQIRFQHWVDEDAYSVGRNIQTEMEEAFDEYACDLDDSRLVRLYHDQSACVQAAEPNDRSWQFTTQFEALVLKDRAS